jgi:hypothetical protein
MHHHLYYLAILPATGMAILGYVALYCAKNSQGRMQTAGKLLAGWAFLLAILIIALVVFHPAMGDRPWGPEGRFGHIGDTPMMDRITPGDQTAPPPPPDTPPTPSTPQPQTSNPTGWKTE